MLAALLAGNASATELRDAELVAGGSPVLQNGSRTVRLEDARLGRIGPTVFVPEPGAPWQLGAAVAVLALLAGRRRRRTHFDTGRRSARSSRSRHPK
jgi:MYXO-CTERM domain-containing protein